MSQTKVHVGNISFDTNKKEFKSDGNELMGREIRVNVARDDKIKNIGLSLYSRADFRV